MSLFYSAIVFIFQVVVCEKAGKKHKVACSIMAHELLHAFDKCRANLDFKDPRHIACTEVQYSLYYFRYIVYLE